MNGSQNRTILDHSKLFKKNLESLAGEVASEGVGFNTAFIGATTDTEVARFTPVVTPGVLDEPVWNTAFSTPAAEHDSVTTEVVTPDIVVDTRGVGIEIGEDIEGNFIGTVGVAFGLHEGGEDLREGGGLGTDDGRAVDAGRGASRGGAEVGGIWDASLSGDTLVLHGSPGEDSGATVAAEIEGIASNEILRRHVTETAAIDSETVASGLSNGESPARAARALVTDSEPSGSPLGTSIESVGEIVSGSVLLSRALSKVESTETSTELGHGHVGVFTGLPGAFLLAVDHFNKGFSIDRSEKKTEHFVIDCQSKTTKSDTHFFYPYSRIIFPRTLSYHLSSFCSL